MVTWTRSVTPASGIKGGGLEVGEWEWSSKEGIGLGAGGGGVVGLTVC